MTAIPLDGALVAFSFALLIILAFMATVDQARQHKWPVLILTIVPWVLIACASLVASLELEVGFFIIAGLIAATGVWFWLRPDTSFELFDKEDGELDNELDAKEDDE